MSETTTEQLYTKLFGKQFDEDVDQLKEDIIKDMNTYEDYIPDIPSMCNVTIDNISVSCDDVVLAAKIVTTMRIYNIDNGEYDFESGNDCVKALGKLVRGFF